MRDDVLRHGGWHLPSFIKTDDVLWLQLGEEWQCIEGVVPEMKLYLRYGSTEAGSIRITGLHIEHPSITGDVLRAIPFGRLASAAFSYAKDGQFRAERLPPLRRAKGEDPDRFASTVAAYYSLFVRFSQKPAKEIAEHSGVPVATVRGWIREARQRGKLPPGTPGRAG